MAKQEEHVFIQYHYALALKTLLGYNKDAVKNGVEDLDHTYGNISSTTMLRKATISKALSGLSEIKAYTLHQILTAMGVTYTQFGVIMDKLTREEILAYKTEQEAEREERKNRDNDS